MTISYCPPKAQGWGHSAARLSPVELYRLPQMFLRDQATLLNEGGLEMDVLWEPQPDDTILVAVGASPLLAGCAPDDCEGPGPFGGFFRRVSRQLAPSSLAAAVELVQLLEPKIRSHAGVTALALHWSVPSCWRQAADSKESAIMLFGASFGQPRIVTTQFEFDSVGHYREIQRYLQQIGLATLSDKHIRPKKALTGGKNSEARLCFSFPN